MKASDNDFPSILFEEQGDKPTTPDTDHWRLYAKSGGLYLVDDGGSEIGPFATSEGPGYSFVGARYSSNAEQNIVNNTTAAIIDFEDEIYDSGPLVTTGASWKFTAPYTGYYHIDCLIAFFSNAGWAVSERVLLQLFKNNNYLLTLDRQDGKSGTIQATVRGNVTVELNAIDYIDVRVAQNSGGDIALENPWINIEQVH
jgi:hypothetical protein